jgi:hypothetical protein
MRFPLSLPMSYRNPGTLDWCSASMQDISWSGVLFASDRELSVGDELELRMALEAEGECHPGEVKARATIVRIAPPPEGRARHWMAAEFMNYEVVPRPMQEG